MGTQLGTVWTHVNGGPLPEGQHWHDSLVDVKAQTDIVVDPRFVPWIDRGRVLTTDNWYTSMALATILFEKYGWGLVGTIVPRDKQTREKLDLPFNKLTKGAREQLKRGWFREAVVKMTTATGKFSTYR